MKVQRSSIPDVMLNTPKVLDDPIVNVEYVINGF